MGEGRQPSTPVAGGAAADICSAGGTYRPDHTTLPQELHAGMGALV